MRARVIGDAEIGTKERGSEFGDKLFDRVGLIAETLAALAIAAGLGAGPVRELVKQRRIVGFRRRARRAADERLTRRQLAGRADRADALIGRRPQSHRAHLRRQGRPKGSGANGRIWPAMMSAELPEGWAWAS